jgi:3',5'-cyclic AMP phosphodiesterase CpdA
MVSAIADKSNVAGHQSTLADEPSTATPITLAHLSDPHISCMENITARDLVSKRLFGYFRWKLHRGAEHESNILSALQSDFRQTQPDHIAVTGDLTHLGLSAEFKKARQWLQELGSPSQVTVIPGNHDAYVKIIWHQTMAHWTDYMISDTPRQDDQKANHTQNIFPSLRIRGCIAIIGVSTARPCAPHLATGSIGATQLQNLAAILARTAQKQLYRVVLIHHPPAPGIVSWRKRLTDSAELRSLLEQYGAELILHGHAHRTLQRNLQTSTGNIPVMGVPSISARGRTFDRRARYYTYRIKPNGDRWNVKFEVRIYSPEKNRFIRESQQQLKSPKNA